MSHEVKDASIDEFQAQKQQEHWIMPEISRFYGIEIRMYPNDHKPPHFHAIYGDHEGAFSISPFGLHEGWLPPRCSSLVWEWAIRNETALMEAWNELRIGRKPAKIAPLE